MSRPACGSGAASSQVLVCEKFNTINFTFFNDSGGKEEQPNAFESLAIHRVAREALPATSKNTNYLPVL